MAFPDLSADFTAILNDAKVTVSYYAATASTDPISGDTTYSYAAAVSKEWIFYKFRSNIKWDKTGLVNIGDAECFIPTTDTMSIGDRVIYDGDTFELTDESIKIKRYMGAYNMFNHYVLFRVDGT